MNINLSHRVQKGLWIAGVLIIGFLAYETISTWLSDWHLTHPEVQTKPAFTAKKGVNSQEIAKAHLFGQDYSDSAGLMPISNLELRLTGIVQDYDGQDLRSAKVYLSMQGGREKIYQVGDEVAPHTKIHAIDRDAVIFENNGHLEKIMLSRPELIFKPQDQME